MTFSIMTLSIMTLSIMTLSIMTLSIMTLSIMDLIATPEVDKAEFGHMCYIERGSPHLTSRCGLP